MAGHSKWANIKHRKGAQDAKRSKIFTRIIKELTIAARDGGADPDTNPSLRLAMQNAKGANMPKDTMERAIKKGSGGDGADLMEVTYEGYAANGIAVFVEATTDNLNRTVANVRSVFGKNGGEMGTNGSLGFLFDRKGVFSIEKEAMAEHDMDEIELELIDGGAEDIEKDEDSWTAYTSFEDFGNMQSKLDELKIEAKSQELQRIATSSNELDVDKAKSVLRLVEAMEEDDDVNTVYHNLELTEELQAALEEE